MTPLLQVVCQGRPGDRPGPPRPGLGGVTRRHGLKYSNLVARSQSELVSHWRQAESSHCYYVPVIQ